MDNPFLVDDQQQQSGGVSASQAQGGSPPPLPPQASPLGQGLSDALQSGARANQLQQLQQQSQQLQNLQPPNLSDQTQHQPGAVKSFFMNYLDQVGRNLSGRPSAYQEWKDKQVLQQNEEKLQQYDTVPYQMPDGSSVYVQRKDLGNLAGRIGASSNKLQGTIAGVNATLAKQGYKMSRDENGNPVIQAIPREQLSDLQRSQLDTDSAKQGLANAQADLAAAKAKGVPAQIAVAQAKVRAYQQAVNAQSANASTNQFNAQTKRDEFQAKYGVTKNPDGSTAVGSEYLRLNPHAQQVLGETQPRLQQVNELIQQLEATKDDDARGAFLGDRLAYATGSAGEGNIAQQVANLELGKIQTSAALAKGNSRNYQFIQDIYKHQPNLYIDSKKLLYEKLSNIRDNLQRIEDGAVKFGNKQGLVNKSDLNGGTPSSGFNFNQFPKAQP